MSVHSGQIKIAKIKTLIYFCPRYQLFTHFFVCISQIKPETFVKHRSLLGGISDKLDFLNPEYDLDLSQNVIIFFLWPDPTHTTMSQRSAPYFWSNVKQTTKGPLKIWDLFCIQNMNWIFTSLLPVTRPFPHKEIHKDLFITLELS